MPDGGAEDACLVLVQIRPRNDVVRLFLSAVFGGVGLFAARDRRGGIKHLDVVVQLLVDRRPVRLIFRNKVRFVEVGDGNGLLRAMAAGLKSKVLKPPSVRGANGRRLAGVADSVAMHRAVQIHSGNAMFMRAQHPFDDGLVADSSGAFVVDYEIVSFGVVGVPVNCEWRLGGFVVRMDLVDGGLDAFFDAGLQDVFLGGVVMAAAAGDEQNLEGFWFLGLGVEQASSEQG